MVREAVRVSAGSGRIALTGIRIMVCLQVVEKIDAAHLGEFLHRNLSPGPVVVSDALQSYPLPIADRFGHKPFTI